MREKRDRFPGDAHTKYKRWQNSRFNQPLSRPPPSPWKGVVIYYFSKDEWLVFGRINGRDPPGVGTQNRLRDKGRGIVAP